MDADGIKIIYGDLRLPVTDEEGVGRLWALDTNWDGYVHYSDFEGSTPQQKEARLLYEVEDAFALSPLAGETFRRTLILYNRVTLLWRNLHENEGGFTPEKVRSLSYELRKMLYRLSGKKPPPSYNINGRRQGGLRGMTYDAERMPYLLRGAVRTLVARYNETRKLYEERNALDSTRLFLEIIPGLGVGDFFAEGARRYFGCVGPGPVPHHSLSQPVSIDGGLPMEPPRDEPDASLPVWHLPLIEPHRKLILERTGIEGADIFDELIQKYLPDPGARDGDYRVRSGSSLGHWVDREEAFRAARQSIPKVARLFQQATIYTTDARALQGAADFILVFTDDYGEVDWGPVPFESKAKAPKEIGEVLKSLLLPESKNVLRTYQGKKGLDLVVKQLLEELMYNDVPVLKACAQQMVRPEMQEVVNQYQGRPEIEPFVDYFSRIACDLDEPEGLRQAMAAFDLPAVQRVIELYKTLEPWPGNRSIVESLATAIFFHHKDPEKIVSIALALASKEVQRLIQDHRQRPDLHWILFPLEMVAELEGDPKMILFAARSLNLPEVREVLERYRFDDMNFAINVFDWHLFRMADASLIRKIARCLKQYAGKKESRHEALFAIRWTLEKTEDARAIDSVTECLITFAGKPAEAAVAAALCEIALHHPQAVRQLAECLQRHAGNPDAETLATELKKLAGEGDRNTLVKRIKQCLGR